MKPKFKPPGPKRLKLECDGLLSNFPYNFNLRRSITAYLAAPFGFTSTLMAGANTCPLLSVITFCGWEVSAACN